MKGLIRRGVMKRLPEDYDVDTHFARYHPWDQRLCLVPDGDLFETLSAELEADLIVTATGPNMLMLGRMKIAVGGRDIDLSDRRL
jgi:monooxygenase